MIEAHDIGCLRGFGSECLDQWNINEGKSIVDDLFG